MKQIEEENVNAEVIPLEKNKNSDVVTLLLLVLIMGCLVIGGFYLLRKEIRDLEDELVHTKEMLSEYGIYIDPQPQNNTSYDTSAYNVIMPSDIANESKGRTIVVWVGRQSCGYCAMFEPYIREASNKYGIKAYYIDLATMIEFNSPQPYILNQKELDILSGLKGKGEWETFAEQNVGGTPMTLIIKDNQVVGGLSGAANTESVMSSFAGAGIKKK